MAWIQTAWVCVLICDVGWGCLVALLTVPHHSYRRKWAVRLAQCRAPCQLWGRTLVSRTSWRAWPESGRSLPFSQGPERRAPCRAPGDAACVHGRAQGSSLTVRCVSGNAFCLHLPWPPRQEQNGHSWRRDYLAAACAPVWTLASRPWPSQVWGGRAQLRDPSPLPRASRRASFSAAGGARGGSLLSLRDAQTLWLFFKS